MEELSLHILDLVQNAISAGARHIWIEVIYEGDTLTIVITDDGCGMDQALLARVTSPFGTTRTTRKVGLGIPMFKQCAEMCAGSFSLESEKGKGTKLTATFERDHVDLPPMGNLAETMKSLVIAAPEKPEFQLVYKKDGKEFVFDTAEIRQALGGVPLNTPDVLVWIGEYLQEGFESVQTR